MYNVSKSTLYFPGRAPVRVKAEVTVQSSAEEIWEVLLDHPGWANWFVGMQQCQDTSSPEKRGKVGSTRKVWIDGLIVQEEFIALETNKVFAFSVYEANVPMFHCTVERLVLEELPEKGAGTKLIYEAGLEIAWFAKWMAPLLRRNMKKCWTQSLMGLDEYIQKTQN